MRGFLQGSAICSRASPRLAIKGGMSIMRWRNPEARFRGYLLALTGFVITSTNSRAIRYPTDQSQT